MFNIDKIQRIISFYIDDVFVEVMKLCFFVCFRITQSKVNVSTKFCNEKNVQKYMIITGDIAQKNVENECKSIRIRTNDDI